jgi:hypothetical protein
MWFENNKQKISPMHIQHHHHLLAIAEKGCCLLMQRDTQQGLWWVVGSEVGFNWNWGLEQITSPFAMENIL